MNEKVWITDGNRLRAIRADTAEHLGIRYGEIVRVGPRLLAVVREDIRRERDAAVKRLQEQAT